MSDVHRLLQFTDPHLFADRHAEMRGICTLESLTATLAEAKDRHWPPDAIIVSGDIAQDESRGAYQLFHDCFAGLGVPVLCLPGNHDNPDYMAESLDYPPFQYCGNVLFGDWLLLLLDTNNPGDAGGQLEPAQLRDIDRQLTETKHKHALICLHHHPISSGSRWLDTVPLRNAAELWKILERHPQVRCLLWGHVHQAFEKRQDGMLLLATPSTCRQFLPNSDDFGLDDARPPAYRWLDLHPDGSIVTAVNWCETATPK